MATIGTSLCSAMKVVSTSISTSQKTAVASKIATRGSFFDQDSFWFKLFMEKHQQKQSSKNTGNTTWNNTK